MKKNIDIQEDLITPRVALSFVSAITAAYDMAAFAADSIDFLGSDFRMQNMPHLKNWAVEYELKRRVKEGLIPFEVSLVFNSKNNHKHVELRKNGCILTASQTRNILCLPRDCVFRNNYCLNGQMVMEGFGYDEPESEQDIYAVITHGWGTAKPAFINCGIPNSKMKAWIQNISLLEMAGRVTVMDESPVTEEIKLDFREKVKKLAELEA